MPNKTYAKEWLAFAVRNLITAQHLFEVRHFTDIIGIELQQCLEKTLKAHLAYQNQKIPKEHDLVKLYFVLEDKLQLDEDAILTLRLATNYFKEDRYPNPNYTLPTEDEIKDVLEFTESLFNTVCTKIDICQDKLLTFIGTKAP